MVQVHIDDRLHALVKTLVAENSIDFPTVKFVIDKAVKEFLEKQGYKVQPTAAKPLIAPEAEVEG